MRRPLFKSLVLTAALSLAPVFSAAEPGPVDFVRLGTASGPGGERWTRYERSQIKHQIKQLIPPNLQPAFTGDAYTLPPGAFRIGFSNRDARIGGDDFRDVNGVDPIDMSDRVVKRNFKDLDVLYGFDLDRRFLHSFTLRVNVPLLDSQVGGRAYPLGFGPRDIGPSQQMTVFGDGSTRDVGDIGVFLKKKIQDQGNFPVGIAMMGGFTLPTGSSSRKFANEGRGVRARMPLPAMMEGMLAMRDLNVNDFLPMLDMPMPVMGNQRTIAFPLSADNVFDRFSPDGRLPALLQPGLGAMSYSAGLFFTRQFLPGDAGPLGAVLGRSAVHSGAVHRFVFEHDGIDPGDTTDFFLSFVKPLYRDYLALDATFLGKRQETDHYDGQIIHPFPGPTPGTVVFRRIDRPPFAGGLSGFIAPSLVFSPDPQIRLTTSALFRVKRPELGPAPAFVSRVAMEVTF